MGRHAGGERRPGGNDRTARKSGRAHRRDDAKRGGLRHERLRRRPRAECCGLHYGREPGPHGQAPVHGWLKERNRDPPLSEKPLRHQHPPGRGAARGDRLSPPDPPLGTRRGIGEKTAAVFYFPGQYAGGNILKLETIIEIAHANDAPVVVDAAAQLPPSSNLWRYTKELGADAAIFSGGKSIGGPQNTGIIVGKKEIIEACAMMGSPRYAIGRPMKAGRDVVVGLLAALAHYLDAGETAQYAHNERWCEFFMERLGGMRGLSPRLRRPNTLGQDLAGSRDRNR